MNSVGIPMPKPIKLIFTLFMLICLPITGCSKRKTPDDSTLQSIQPNEAQRVAREAKSVKRQKANITRAVDRAKKFKVLSGVFHDNGLAMTSDEWAAAHTVEACYSDTWQKVLQKTNSIFTEEQKAIREGVKGEIAERGITGADAYQLLKASVPMTAEQTARNEIVQQLKKDIRYEAVEVLINLISPEHVHEDFIPRAVSGEHLAGIDVSEDQKRDVWSIDLDRRYAIDEVNNRKEMVGDDVADRVRSVLFGTARPEIERCLTAEQIANLGDRAVSKVLKNETETESESVGSSQGAFVSTLVEDVELSRVQLEGVKVIDDAISESISTSQEAWLNQLTAEQWVAGKRAYESGVVDGIADEELEKAVRSAESWSDEQLVNSTSVHAEVESIVAVVLEGLEQILLSDQYEGIRASVEVSLIERFTAHARTASDAKLASKAIRNKSPLGKLTVLRTVVDASKNKFSSTELKQIRSVESLYTGVWQRSENELEALLTEEQQAISRRILDVGWRIVRPIAESIAIVLDYFALTEEQAAKKRMLWRMRQQLRREATAHLARLIGHEKVHLQRPFLEILPGDLTVAHEKMLAIFELETSQSYTLMLAEDSKIPANRRKQQREILNRISMLRLQSMLPIELTKSHP